MRPHTAGVEAEEAADADKALCTLRSSILAPVLSTARAKLCFAFLLPGMHGMHMDLIVMFNSLFAS